MAVGREKQVSADEQLNGHGENEALARRVRHLIGEQNDHHPATHFVDLFFVQETIVVVVAARSVRGYGVVFIIRV